ncbi:hypothetical protein CONPUDRAFT_154504 [Coniophora puteana RWD-64-598 SS2]|uniref:Uncharacterized protein n=1 Tax=Coniophora puteana (strain RWD-64-598) TaxID=741705 RepID=A0A5M3MMZ2_CONPW|nr:uncharacterized protein CONPUDRAFT_154504 [Coniophora puteana RWD-64-598 SS2]EIW80473.1 hypothetical protein CONPUDRAFT_154504 [Coniophora puteana RWD-64-598 SS2]
MSAYSRLDSQLQPSTLAVALHRIPSPSPHPPPGPLLRPLLLVPSFALSSWSPPSPSPPGSLSRPSPALLLAPSLRPRPALLLAPSLALAPPSSWLPPFVLAPPSWFPLVMVR